MTAVNLDFRCSYKSKNNGEKLPVLPRSLVMKLFEATTAGFAEREKKLYCRLDCSSEWLHSLYLWLVTCDLYS